MPPPKRDIFVVTRSGEYLVVRMNSQTPELSAVTEDDLIESSLQRTLENIVSRRADVNIAIVAAWTLRIDASHSTR